jgi:hypothetical protein
LDLAEALRAAGDGRAPGIEERAQAFFAGIGVENPI